MTHGGRISLHCSPARGCVAFPVTLTPFPEERTPRTLNAQCAAEPRTCRTIEHPTSNAEHRIDRRIGCSVFDVFLGFMGSEHLQKIGRELGALNLRGPGLGVPPSGGPDRLKPELRTRGSWKGNSLPPRCDESLNGEAFQGAQKLLPLPGAADAVSTKDKNPLGRGEGERLLRLNRSGRGRGPGEREGSGRTSARLQDSEMRPTRMSPGFGSCPKSDCA